MKTGIAARALLLLIRGYQLTLSTVMGKQCRYYPSCSYYTAEAVGRFGALRGGWMGLKRILRCHPWGGGGYDPVPLGCGGEDKCDRTPHHSNNEGQAS